MGGGAWPFSVGGVVCVVNSVNEQGLRMLNSAKYASYLFSSWMDFCVSHARKFEAITVL